MQKKYMGIKAPIELISSFDSIFGQQLYSLNIFSVDEINEMIIRIKSVEHGWINIGEWHKNIYNEYFLGKKYNWPVLEEFKNSPYFDGLKKYLLQDGINKEYISDKSYKLYSELIRFIDWKTKSCADIMRSRKHDGIIFKYVYNDDLSEKYGIWYLNRYPSEYPPFFPGDMTIIKRVFNL